MGEGKNRRIGEGATERGHEGTTILIGEGATERGHEGKTIRLGDGAKRRLDDYTTARGREHEGTSTLRKELKNEGEKISTTWNRMHHSMKLIVTNPERVT